MNDDEYKRGILTSLGYYKLFNLSPDETVLNGIIKPSPTDVPSDLVKDIASFAKEFFKSRRIQPFQVSDELPLYATTKAGANGPSASGVTSLRDYKAILESSVLTKVRNLVSKVYTERQQCLFQSVIEETDAKSQDIPESSNLVSSRLHLLSEGGGKTRVIAIPDIWTQSALKPIHNYLMNCLKLMPCDGTFSHSRLASKMKKVTAHHGLYCYDLTAATDRFPLTLQKEVLRPLLGDIVDD